MSLKAINGKIHAGSIKTGPLCNRVPLDGMKNTTKPVDCGLCLRVQEKRAVKATTTPAKPPVKVVETKTAVKPRKTATTEKAPVKSVKVKLPKALVRKAAPKPAPKPAAEYYINRAPEITVTPEHGYWTVTGAHLTSAELANLSDTENYGEVGLVQGISFRWIVRIGHNNEFIAVCLADGPAPKVDHLYDTKIIAPTAKAPTEAGSKYAAHWVLAEMYRALMTELLADAHMAMLSEGFAN